EADRDRSSKERVPLQSGPVLQDTRQIRGRREVKSDRREFSGRGDRQLRVEPWYLCHGSRERCGCLGLLEAHGAEDRDRALWLTGGPILAMQGEACRTAARRAYGRLR